MKKRLLQWLRDHDLISIHLLEKKAGLAQGTLHKALKGTRDLSDHHVAPLVAILKNYGLKAPAIKPASPAAPPGEGSRSA